MQCCGKWNLLLYYVHVQDLPKAVDNLFRYNERRHEDFSKLAERMSQRAELHGNVNRHAWVAGVV